MPWLCKKMRRPKVGEKKVVSVGKFVNVMCTSFKTALLSACMLSIPSFILFADHEPDLKVISRDFPVPNNPPSREIQIVLETIRQGPRARMPVHWAVEDVPAPAQAANPAVPSLPSITNQGSANQNNSKPAAVPAAAAQVNQLTMPTIGVPNMQHQAALSAMGVTNLNSWPVAAGFMHPNPAAFTMGQSNDDFAAGFRAAARLFNSTPSMSGNIRSQGMGLGLGLAASIGTNSDYARQIQLLQMAAAQGNHGASNQGRNGTMEDGAGPSAPNNTSNP
jgi:hypothetical protein